MNRTKALIVDTFWQLLEEKPYSKITVKNIVDCCQINRNTFYYHFHDIPELVEDTIKNDANEIIRTYSRFGSPLECLTPLAEHCKQKKKALLHIYHSAQREVFLNQLERICLYVVTQYVDNVTKDMSLSEEDRNLMLRFYKCLLVGIFLDWLGENMNYDIEKDFKRLTELFGDAGMQALLKAGEAAQDGRPR